MAAPCPKYRCLLMVVMVVATLISNQYASAQLCSANISKLISECEKYVQKSGPKVRPSRSCCAVVKPIDIPCVCRVISREIESMVDMGKVVYVARSCGKQIKPGTKCGDYTVPPV